ncbi:2011_t:CDS:2, partial [Scutellospora calospora]
MESFTSNDINNQEQHSSFELDQYYDMDTSISYLSIQHSDNHNLSEENHLFSNQSKKKHHSGSNLDLVWNYFSIGKYLDDMHYGVICKYCEVVKVEKNTDKELESEMNLIL